MGNNVNKKESVCWIVLGVLAGGGVGWLLSQGIDSSILHYPLFGIFYWGTAFGWSAFLAKYAFIIHGVAIPPELSKRTQQYFLNFLGGLVGWTLLYLFVKTDFFASFQGLEKLVLFAAIFIGITGYLPYILLVKWLPGVSKPD